MPHSKTSTRLFLPYGRQHITQEDIEAVVSVLKSDWLTQGPTIEAFERALARYLGAREVVACSSGTAALHLAMLALGIGEGDVAVTTPITFVATANCARYVGASVDFADIDAATALMSPSSLEEVLAKRGDQRVKVVLPVHFAGQAADLPAIHDLARRHGAYVVDDACHAIGGGYEANGQFQKLGGGHHSDLTVFSFHPVKHMTTGEGGAIATNDAALAERLRQLRCHGIQREAFVQDEMAYDSEGIPNPWYHELPELGFNYRITDIQAALGISQLGRLEESIEKRNQLAAVYDGLVAERFDPARARPLANQTGRRHAYHLYVLLIDFDHFGVERATVMNRLRAAEIGTQVHYIPVHLQPYYRTHAHTNVGDYPNAERYYRQALSIPMFPQMTSDDCDFVTDTLRNVLAGEL